MYIDCRKQQSLASEGFSSKTFDSVANDSATYLSTSRYSQTRNSSVVNLPDNKKTLYGNFIGIIQKCNKIGTLSKPCWLWKRTDIVSAHIRQGYYLTAIRTARFLRPFALLRLMTRRPFLVDILTRKPWVLLREMLLGWNVLFIVFTPGIVLQELIL